MGLDRRPLQQLQPLQTELQLIQPSFAYLPLPFTNPPTKTMRLLWMLIILLKRVTDNTAKILAQGMKTVKPATKVSNSTLIVSDGILWYLLVSSGIFWYLMVSYGI